MKKTTLLAAVAIIAGMSACNRSSAPTASLKNQVDSLSYAIGVSQSQGLKQYLAARMGVDTTEMSEFVRGVNDGTAKLSKKEAAYMAGLQIGQQISGQMIEGLNTEVFQGDSTKQISKDNLVAGFIDGALEKGVKIPVDTVQTYIRQTIDDLHEKSAAVKYADNKNAGEKFLEENKQKEGVKVTESGLQYKVLKEGHGAVPADTSRVKVHYKGTLIDGTQFDSSYDRKEPSIFRANQVIKGWTEALTMMPVGSKWELYIPQQLAYGSRETGQIPPYSTLIFEVELLGIEK